MKPIPLYGTGAAHIDITWPGLDRQAFRFYGNEIYDYGYAEPIGHGVHVYTVQLAALFLSKTVRLVEDGKQKFCFGQKQAPFYRAGYDAGRDWWTKNYAVRSGELYGSDPAKLVLQIHRLAFHNKTGFIHNERTGTPIYGVYNLKLQHVPINARALRWAGYYAAITAGIIEMVTRHTAIFHQYETCALLTAGSAPKKELLERVKWKVLDALPICQQRTYAIEKQPKIPLDYTDVVHITTRVSQQRLVTLEQLPDYLTALGFEETEEDREPDDFSTEREFINYKPYLTNLIVYVDGDQLRLCDGRDPDKRMYWKGEDPNELLNQILANANNLQARSNQDGAI